jgi:hypothetical protein
VSLFRVLELESALEEIVWLPKAIGKSQDFNPFTLMNGCIHLAAFEVKAGIIHAPTRAPCFDDSSSFINSFCFKPDNIKVSATLWLRFAR